MLSIVLHRLCLSLLSTFCPCTVSEFLTDEGKTILHFVPWQLNLKQGYPPSRVISEYILLLILLSEIFYRHFILYSSLGNHLLKRSNQLCLFHCSQPLAPTFSPLPFLLLPLPSPYPSVAWFTKSKPLRT